MQGWYPACVQEMNVDGTYRLRYDDKDGWDRAPIDFIRLKSNANAEPVNFFLQSNDQYPEATPGK
jgi:hypothetical protein